MEISLDSGSKYCPVQKEKSCPDKVNTSCVHFIWAGLKYPVTNMDYLISLFNLFLSLFPQNKLLLL
jgi:hypothetical protein